jgi:hypothetical protein
LVPAGCGFARDQAVERRLPADHPAHELVAKPAVGRREPCGGQCRFQQIFGEFTTGKALGKNPRRNLSWILVAQGV